MHTTLDYPAERRIEASTGGPILLSPVIDGGVLLSTRGEDFVLTLGQDATVGYHSHDPHSVKLYLTESLAFRVLTPGALLWLTA